MREWLHIDFELFHFLRPQWLWLFVPLAVILLISLLGNRSKQKWHSVIEQKLRPFMIQKGSRFAIIAPLLVSIVILSLMILAATGPTWKKREVPGAKSEAILLIALDLSPSMLVEDASPNRLERAKFKVRDLLDENPGSKVGLIVYAGTAHPVVTPTRDYKLVAYQLESLHPGIMPLAGTNLTHALNLADTILSRTTAPSTLLLITDNIEVTEATKLKEFVSNSKNTIELMPMATIQGGRIPGPSRGSFIRKNGEFIISKLNQNVLFDLQQHSNIYVNTLTFDKQDVKLIATTVRNNLVYQQDAEGSEEDWQEMGFVLLWPVLILFALWFRKGWMIQWCVVLLVFSSCQSEIKSWDDLWYTKDYQGQKAFNGEDYEDAANTYESLQHKGIAYYKAGNYEAAIQLFQQDSSVASLYNLGLAYAANGQYALAQEALLLANEKEPGNEIINNTLGNNEQRMRQMDSMRSVNPDEAIELKEEKETQGQLNERAAAGQDEELTSDTEVKELPKEGNRVTDEVETGMRKAEELERPPEDFQPQTGDAAQNVLLREISADPSEFLKRRFKYQYDKYYSNEKQPEERW